VCVFGCVFVRPYWCMCVCVRAVLDVEAHLQAAGVEMKRPAAAGVAELLPAATPSAGVVRDPPAAAPGVVARPPAAAAAAGESAIYLGCSVKMHDLSAVEYNGKQGQHTNELP
jgi:hypothetical protein